MLDFTALVDHSEEKVSILYFYSRFYNPVFIGSIAGIDDKASQNPFDIKLIDKILFNVFRDFDIDCFTLDLYMTGNLFDSFSGAGREIIIFSHIFHFDFFSPVQNMINHHGGIFSNDRHDFVNLF